MLLLSLLFPQILCILHHNQLFNVKRRCDMKEAYLTNIYDVCFRILGTLGTISESARWRDTTDN